MPNATSDDTMPPQPLSKVNPNAGYGLGPGFLAMRPHLAALVAEVIALWSEIELQRGRYLASLLSANESVGIAMYLAITSAVTRRATLNAASKMILSEQEYELFCKAVKATGTVEKERNDFAHQLWGISEELPDALLMVDTEYRLTHMLEVNALMEQRRSRIGQGAMLTYYPRLDPSQIKVYRQADLERSRDRANGIHRFSLVFRISPMVQHATNCVFSY